MSLKTLLGFVVQGSAENLHNLPGRPLLDPVLGIFFVIGLERVRDQASRRSSDPAERRGDSIAGRGVDRSGAADAPLDGGLSAGGHHRSIGLVTAMGWITDRLADASRSCGGRGVGGRGDHSSGQGGRSPITSARTPRTRSSSGNTTAASRKWPITCAANRIRNFS